MTSAVALPVSELPQRMQKLPQELYDQIFDLVFESPPDSTAITQSWTPPPQLHVSRKSRLRFAIQYYGKGAFHFHDPGLLARWFATMTSDHRSLLKRGQTMLHVQASWSLANAESLAFTRFIVIPIVFRPLPEKGIGLACIAAREASPSKVGLSGSGFITGRRDQRCVFDFRVQIGADSPSLRDDWEQNEESELWFMSGHIDARLPDKLWFASKPQEYGHRSESDSTVCSLVALPPIRHSNSLEELYSSRHPSGLAVMVTPRATFDSLIRLTQGLPPELFGMIFNFTLAAEKRVINIDASYTPPAMLQISRESRYLFAASYYTKSTFAGHSIDRAYFTDWAQSLPNNHLPLLRSIRYTLFIDIERTVNLQTPRTRLYQQLRYLRAALGQAFLNSAWWYVRWTVTHVEGAHVT